MLLHGHLPTFQGKWKRHPQRKKWAVKYKPKHPTSCPGIHLRMEVTNFQRTLILSTNQDKINVEPFQHLQPWCDNKPYYPRIFENRDPHDQVLFSRMVRCLYESEEEEEEYMMYILTIASL
jgi:hypothetical protein